MHDLVAAISSEVTTRNTGVERYGASDKQDRIIDGNAAGKGKRGKKFWYRAATSMYPTVPLLFLLSSKNTPENTGIYM